MKSVDIYSDIDFDGFQHVNQMLSHHLAENSIKVNFYQRVIMNYPSKSNLYRCIKNLLKNKVFRQKRLGIAKKSHKNICIKRIYNFPSFCTAFDYINYFLVHFQIRSYSKNAITFCPSLSFNKIFSKYENLIYYCVHDSEKQSYSERHKKYESKLIELSSYVFCDNEIVLNRLCYSFSNILEYSNSKFILVPAPIPSDFFKKFNVNKIYDFVYFGSIHKDIDINTFRKLTVKGYKVLIISDVSINIKGVVNLKPFSDFNELCLRIHSAKNILLPYKNSDFMNSITPAKIYQSIATGLPVITTNNSLRNRFNLDLLSEDLCFKSNNKSADVEKYKVSSLFFDFDKLFLK